MHRIFRNPPALFFGISLVFFVDILLSKRTFYAFDTLWSKFPWALFAGKGFGAHNPLITDPVNLFLVFQDYFHSCIQHGHFPLWFDRILCGLPFTAGSSPLYLFFFGVLPIPFGHDLFLFLMLWVTAVFSYYYLRELGISPFASTIGALAWAFNGYLMVWFEFEIVSMAAWTMPACLLFIERLFRRPTKASFLALSICFSLMLTGALIHLCIYQVLFIALYAAYRFLCIWKKTKTLPRRLHHPAVMIVGALLLGTILSSSTIMNSLHTLSESQREGLSFSALYEETGKVYPQFLITGVIPDFFGSPTKSVSYIPRKTSQSYNNYNELCLYAGIIPLLLALTGLLAWRRERKILFFLIGAIVTLAMAMGSRLYAPLSIIPGLNISTPTRILYITHFCIAMTSGLALDALVKQKNSRYVHLAMGIVGCAIVAVMSAVYSGHGLALLMPDFLQGNDFLRSAIRSRLSPLSATLLKPCVLLLTSYLWLISLRSAVQSSRTVRPLQLLGVALLLADLIAFGWDYNTRSPASLAYPVTPAISRIQSDTSCFRVATLGGFDENGLSPFSIDNIGGYASLYPRRYGSFFYTCMFIDRAFLKGNASRWLSPSIINPAMFDVLNVKYVLIPPDARADIPGLSRVYNKEVGIYENRAVFPRAFFVGGAHFCPSEAYALDKIATFSRDDFMRTVLIEEKSSPMTGPAQTLGRDTLVGATLLSRTPNGRRYAVDCPADGFLVTSENYDRGWIAYVDGRSERVIRGNCCMQVVPLTAGRHTVVLSFRPRDMLIGYGISLAAWTGIFMFWFLIVLCNNQTSLVPRFATGLKNVVFSRCTGYNRKNEKR